ncbi:SRPBCC family protein [Pseudonocardia sp. KRD-184]|uniref:SRPBCC family protein n=1 Tax=Pseudonocardia oceani TaxID=2792013 RepID=A0ABS6UDX3_9PSEU|nr:SRPBCC family protein [Pseudonocardia oceani]MBW0094830.1 SRPBCC family protein [Pseudonocardia oceani]MBW0107608.1 SRPBCC family protein [Pseudonocardia oceani]MBW0121009.1 SRPBCC family protein [Pseudonocardia oceani]MBW0130452.1 SRPBCC family protein [Pseudonocardia oceani]
MDGRTVTSSVVVAAPAAEVFALLANPHRHHEFDGSGTVRGATSGPERLALGDRFGMDMKMRLPYRITNRVVEFEQDRLIGWCHPARAIWRYELEPVDGGTRVTETFDFTGSPVARGIELFGMHKGNAKSIRDTLRRLQTIFGSPAQV